jgi:hypothetical protein
MFCELRQKYAGLEQVISRLCRENSHYVLAKLDVLPVNLGRMPAPNEVKQFKRSVNKLIERICRELRVKKKDVGVLYVLEFGGKNTYLHAHAVYCGPRLPRPRVDGQQGPLSQWWEKACEGTVFAGSRIVSVKVAENFKEALGHALKYPTKFLSRSSPERLAELEATLHGVRQVSTLGAFYKLPKDQEGEGCGPECPRCGAALAKDSGLWPIALLQRDGLMELGEARRLVKREKDVWVAPCRGSPEEER